MKLQPIFLNIVKFHLTDSNANCHKESTATLACLYRTSGRFYMHATTTNNTLSDTICIINSEGPAFGVTLTTVFLSRFRGRLVSTNNRERGMGVP